MRRGEFDNLHAFILVARERSFTRAAAQLGVTQSALSHTISGLEARMGVRLLTRTTRGVAPTEAGERLFASLTPLYEGIAAELASVGDAQGKPAGSIRISAHDHAAGTILWPRLAPLLARYRDIRLEIDINYGLIDIVAERFDAGVRLGDQVAKDMIAMRISPDVKMAVVGSPAYFAAHTAPATPQDLTDHNCINMRLPTHGGLYAWEFDKGGAPLEVKVDGQATFNSTPLKLQAAVDGRGLAYVPEDMVAQHVAEGRLCQVLRDWCPAFPGYHLYYLSRRQPSAAFTLMLEALKASPGS